MQHALIHGQAALYPLVFLAVIDEFGVSVGAIALLAAAGAISSGMLQLAFGALTRRFSRRSLLGAGGVFLGVTTALQAAMPGFGPFAVANVASKVGGAPQHPVGNALIAEQYGPERRGFAISAHISGGNVGTVLVGAVAVAAISGLGWRAAVVLLGLAAIGIGMAILWFVRETGTDRARAQAAGTVRDAYRRVAVNRDLRWLFLSAVLGGGARGLGVLNIFVPLYLATVLELDGVTIGAMYVVLLAASVPGPLAAGWMSDRIGRKPLIVGAYLGGALSLAVFVLAGTDLTRVWAAIALLSVFSFVESPQLQALLADITPDDLRDAGYSTYFALAFGVGSLWLLAYGALVDTLGERTGLTFVFWLMAGASVSAALAILPVRVSPHRPQRAVE